LSFSLTQPLLRIVQSILFVPFFSAGVVLLYALIASSLWKFSAGALAFRLAGTHPSEIITTLFLISRALLFLFCFVSLLQLYILVFSHPS
jgi:hypothetical protein